MGDFDASGTATMNLSGLPGLSLFAKEAPMADKKSKPAPLEIGEGEQKDDNIDDLGRKPDGSKQEQPSKDKP
jgi:hypothetical protein